jgi:hypothetical protein
MAGATPDLFFAEIVDDLWKTMPDDEALDDFRIRVENVPWWAQDVVDCLERVLRERPNWAATTLVDASKRGQWLGPSPVESPGPYLAWLTAQDQEMRAALVDPTS